MVDNKEIIYDNRLYLVRWTLDAWNMRMKGLNISEIRSGPPTASLLGLHFVQRWL